MLHPHPTTTVPMDDIDVVMTNPAAGIGTILGLVVMGYLIVLWSRFKDWRDDRLIKKET
jgi:hypothetical protein